MRVFSSTLLLASLATSSAVLRGIAQQEGAQAIEVAQHMNFPTLPAHRNLQASDGKICSQTELQTRLQALLMDPKSGCLETLPPFIDSLSTGTSTQAQKVESIDGFCSATCGVAYNKMMSEYRAWCASPEGEYEAADAPASPPSRVRLLQAEAGAMELSQTFALFACAKDADSNFCAVTGLSLEAGDETSRTFMTSCCMGELNRIVPLGEDAIANAEAEVPGARAAAATTCASA